MHESEPWDRELFGVVFSSLSVPCALGSARGACNRSSRLRRAVFDAVEGLNRPATYLVPSLADTMFPDERYPGHRPLDGKRTFSTCSATAGLFLAEHGRCLKIVVSESQ